ncbi:ABC-type Fe3+-hydroxamate transport system, substrate-binding protein [Rhodococcoides kyotonense]|uniref:ABC-type Fe3+-hydroxamate transport system, substrate-binding protein n=2 Tax=Rhodococcoides kyotonense TaxID=398843 RepID=A0A239L7R3_9NOCA|nr:ABC-type Fe3+-hydroxamate transport system, substrate-binding protein [Rhodococcus kyotonensis]
MDISRRSFGIGLGAAGIAAFLAGCNSSGDDAGADAAATKTVTTPLGTYDIPVDPKRVVAIDSRLDLEPAVALELPIIGYTYAPATPWVPVGDDARYLSEIPNREQILALQPDLIVCLNSDSEWWPVNDLSTIAPVLTTEFEQTWRTNLDNLAGWLGRTPTLDKLILDYDSFIDDVRTRHEAKIASRTVASVSFLPDTNMLYVTSIRTTEKGDKPSDMTLTDIGGTTLTMDGLDGEGGIAIENVDQLSGVDGFMVTDEPDSAEYAALAGNTLWQRLPAVQAGNVTTLGGSTYYGSIYTVSYVAKGWDALYSKMV